MLTILLTPYTVIYSLLIWVLEVLHKNGILVQEKSHGKQMTMPMTLLLTLEEFNASVMSQLVQTN